MKIKESGSNFEPCPEFIGKGVCVDVTPLKRVTGQYGDKDNFKLVFEVDLESEPGKRFCVWSKNFTPSLHEKAGLRKFLRSWFGRDLTKEELGDFETESLIGKPAQLVVAHEFKDGETYANIVACTPDRSGSPLMPSGKFKRKKDRQAEPAPNGAGAPGDSGYRRAEAAAEGASPEAEDYAAVKVHVGRCAGMELRDLSPEQVGKLVEAWVPEVMKKPKMLADDVRLVKALEKWSDAQAAAAAAAAAKKADDLNY